MGRNRRRSLLAVGAIALAQTTLVFVNGFMAGSYDQMLQTITGPMIGHVQVNHSQWREERAIDLRVDHLDAVLSQLSGLTEVLSASPRLYSTVLPALSGVEVLSWREAMPEFGRMIDMKDWFDLIFLAIVFIAAASGIANTSMMSSFERTREFGMLLAIGLRPARVVQMVLVESVLLGLAGVLIGSLVGSGLVLLTAHTGINYAALAGVEASDIAFGGVSISYMIYPIFELRHILFGFIAVIITSALASTWPATLAARLEPAKAMRP